MKYWFIVKVSIMHVTIVALVGVVLNRSPYFCSMQKSEKSWVRTQRQRSQEGRARENRQQVQVMIVLQRVREKLQRQTGLAPAHMSKVVSPPCSVSWSFTAFLTTIDPVCLVS